VVNCFVSGAPELRSYPGYATSITAEAICLLTTRPMIRGEPAEAIVGPDAPEHLGGLVTFCRYVSDGIYEIGVQILARARTPILAGAGPDWVGEALRASHGSAAPYRQSA
jgi:hypothetical protein